MLKNMEFLILSAQISEKILAGALTVILPKKEIIPNLITANLDSVAIRCPQNQIFLKLLNKLPFPLAAPSANPFGYVSPTSPEHVNCSLGSKLELILDGGDCSIGIESTIVDLRNCNEAKILRPGPISKEELEKIAGLTFEYSLIPSANQLRAPGMLKSHYSPITPLKITPIDQLKKLVALNKDLKKAFIFLKRPKFTIHKKQSNVYWLSDDGGALDIAQNFYQLLRETDASNYKIIYIEAINENKGLKAAIKDRLSKAAWH